MYDFKISESYDDCYHIKYQGFNGTKQVMKLIAYRWIYNYSNTYRWYISFQVDNKKYNKFKYREQTGTDGLKSLLWAKNCLKDFISKLDRTRDNIVVVCWSDSKRKNAYIRALKDLGFFLTRDDRVECLMLKVDKIN